MNQSVARFLLDEQFWLSCTAIKLSRPDLRAQSRRPAACPRDPTIQA